MNGEWIIGLAVGLTLVLSIAALADWDPGDCFKMHYPQLPPELIDPLLPSMDVAFQLGRLADDWECTYDGEVTDIGASTSGKIFVGDELVGEVDLMFSHIDQNISGLEFPEENFVFTDEFRALLSTYRGSSNERVKL